VPQDALIVQLVVTFFRNLLAVPDARSTSGSRGDHRTRLRGELLQRLADDHVLELLLVFAQHTDVVGCKVVVQKRFSSVLHTAMNTSDAEGAHTEAPTSITAHQACECRSNRGTKELPIICCVLQGSLKNEAALLQ